MFSVRLKHFRKKKGLTQQDMADLLGITRQGYRKYESGESETDNNTLVKLADFFDVTTDYLLGRSNDPRLTAAQEEKVNKELSEVIKIIESLPEEEKKRKIDMILAYTKGITDADKD